MIRTNVCLLAQKIINTFDMGIGTATKGQGFLLVQNNLANLKITINMKKKDSCNGIICTFTHRNCMPI